METWHAIVDVFMAILNAAYFFSCSKHFEN